MQAPRPDLFPRDVAEEIKGRVGDLLTDEQVTVEVQYRRPGSPDYDETTGKASRNTGKWTFRAVRSRVTEREALASGGHVQAGDWKYLFLKSELPLEPTDGDEVREGGRVVKLTRWEDDAQGLQWMVSGRENR